MNITIKILIKKLKEALIYNNQIQSNSINYISVHVKMSLVNTLP